jgi:outer membrane immunogenic protein
MKKIVGGLVAAGAIVGAASAFAADLPAQVYKAAPAPVAVPVAFSWTGFYIGGHVGATRTRSQFDGVTRAELFPGFISVGGIPALAPIVVVPSRFGDLPAVSSSNTGFIGGGQLGYNWQISNFLLGFEGDASWARTRASAAFAPVDPFGFVTLTGTYGTNIDWTASARGRLGVTFDRVLVYATGGAAFIGGDITSGFVLTNPVPAIFFPNPGFSGITAASARFNAVGWTVGGGIEWAFADNWSIAGEYRYSDFGRQSFTVATSDPSGQLGLTRSIASVRLTTDQATLRLNYRFGAAPVVAARY